MYCKNCGKPMDDVAAVCVNCGAPKMAGNNFCPNCGAQTAPGAAFCLSCGVALNPQAAAAATGAQKEKIVAGLLAIFLGQLGVHNFYLGYNQRGVIQLLITLLLSWTFIAPIAVWVWAIIEAVKIFQGTLPDANGNPLK